MKVDSQLFRAQLECRTSDLPNTITGAIWYRTDTSTIKVATGSGYISVSTLAADGTTIQNSANVLSVISGGLSGIPASAITGGVVQAWHEVTISATATTSWTVPTGVTEVFVEMQGAGGGGGGGNNTVTSGQAFGGGGGGGGGWASIVQEVTPGAVLSLTIGTGGAAGVIATNPGGTGGNGTSTVFNGATVTGGTGGGGGTSSTVGTAGGGGIALPFSVGTPGGVGGTASGGNGAAGTRTILFAGGNGGTGTGVVGGGGGGGASMGAAGGAGGNASGNTPGVAATLGAGGGGGSGGQLSTGAGGKGGDGYIKIRYAV